ncbi:MAG: SCP2 sterol-binding domain-containing protein [Gammaproteobacteria bacterium]|jgi:ubiquinone biosynthesis protein UbiJ|nr:SCP2 sterol-binding domain-containing protein [Gammaproteobacteria bacterium]
MEVGTLLQDTGLKLLERSLNTLLSLDEDAAKRLAPLRGKLVEISTRAPSLRFYVDVDGDELRLRSDAGRAPDTVISGSTLGMLRHGFGDDAQAALQRGDMHIAGDLQAGTALRALFGQLDIDLEEQISRLTGDVLAHQLGNLARDLRRWAGDGADSLRHGLGEYLREESRLLADRHDTASFLDEVDILRNDTDRLQHRIARLQARLREDSAK